MMIGQRFEAAGLERIRRLILLSVELLLLFCLEVNKKPLCTRTLVCTGVNVVKTREGWSSF